jgi:hypothetical protein
MDLKSWFSTGTLAEPRRLSADALWREERRDLLALGFF